MYPLLLFSLVTWVVIFERIWSFRLLRSHLREFHAEATALLLRGDYPGLYRYCVKNPRLPNSRLIAVALERMGSSDSRFRTRWWEALERNRQMINHELREYLWILGTIGSASPFVGLFGTVVGILRSFQEMARTGAGGFNVVAGGISESLIATAVGIVVAVVAVLAYNFFQVRWQRIVLMIRLQMEEVVELFPEAPPEALTRAISAGIGPKAGTGTSNGVAAESAHGA